MSNYYEDILGFDLADRIIPFRKQNQMNFVLNNRKLSEKGQTLTDNFLYSNVYIGNLIIVPMC
jgi:hypothetical protein